MSRPDLCSRFFSCIQTSGSSVLYQPYTLDVLFKPPKTPNSLAGHQLETAVLFSGSVARLRYGIFMS